MGALLGSIYSSPKGAPISTGADGKTAIAYAEEKQFGLDYYQGMSGSPFVRNTNVTGNTVSFDAEGRFGVSAKGRAGLFGYDIGELRLEGGAKASGSKTARAKDGSPILYVDWGNKATFARDGNNGTRWIGENKTGNSYAAAMWWDSFGAMQRTDKAVDLQTGGRITSVSAAYADEAT